MPGTPLPERIAGLVRTAYLPERMNPASIRNPLGPFHLVAAWSSAYARPDEHGMLVADGYDLIWHWSPEGIRGRVYTATYEPKGAVDYWRAEVLYDAPAEAFSFEEAVRRIERHQALITGG